jgi:hypothetical protein
LPYVHNFDQEISDFFLIRAKNKDLVNDEFGEDGFEKFVDPLSKGADSKEYEFVLSLREVLVGDFRELFSNLILEILCSETVIISD